MLERIVNRLKGRELVLDFDSRIVLEFKFKENSFDTRIVKQDMDRDVSKSVRTPYSTISVCAVPELRSDIIYLLGDNYNKCEIKGTPYTKLHYLENALCGIYCYAKNNNEFLEKHLIIYNLFKDVMEEEIECPKCNKKHKGINLYCEDCLKKFDICSECGTHITNDSFIEKNGLLICYNCAIKHGKYEWADYSDKREPNFISCQNEHVYEDTRYYGFELEVEDLGTNYTHVENTKIITSKFDNVYFKTDGSLDDGIEIIHQPATLQYHTQNVKPLLELVAKLGYGSHHTAGLHIHVGKNCFGATKDIRVNNIGKLLYFSSKYYDELVTLSFREREHLSYCREFIVDTKEQYHLLGDDSVASKSSDISFSDIVKDFIRNDSRYHCINLFFTPTVEFRLPLSTLDYEQFILQVQLFDRMIDLCCDDNIDITQVEFDALCGKYEILDKFIKKLLTK